jgi:hypothetical protein
MNKVILAVGLALGLSACDGTPNTSTWPLQQPDANYEIDAWGSNPDLLEFRLKTAPDYVCVLAVSGADELKNVFCVLSPVE